LAMFTFWERRRAGLASGWTMPLDPEHKQP
jgi:hypothetical protein